MYCKVFLHFYKCVVRKVHFIYLFPPQTDVTYDEKDHKVGYIYTIASICMQIIQYIVPRSSWLKLLCSALFI